MAADSEVKQTSLGPAAFAVSVSDLAAACEPEAGDARATSSAKASPFGRKRVAPPIVNKTPSVRSTFEVFFLTKDMVFLAAF
jgi:hypothetical protein